MNYTLYTASPDVLNVEIKEVLRYLNVKAPDEAILDLINSCISEVKSAVSLKAVYVKSRVEIYENTVAFDFMDMTSAKLADFLSGAEEAYLFVATLGARADMLVNKYLKVQASKGVVINAVCIALIEAFCDKLNGYLLGCETSTKRFSPGYGDLSIEYQAELLKNLDAERKVGVTLTDSYLMVPTKTVSAIVGIK